MSRQICPLFDRSHGEKITLVGAWMMHPVNLQLVPDSANFMELGHIGPMAASYFRNESHRQIPNDETDVGNGCVFIGGAFMMGSAHHAPNEAGGLPGIDFVYVMKDNNGITICVREQRSSGGASTPGTEERKWWQFWK